MKKIISYWPLIAFCVLLLAACNLATPENYFDQAVLNSNMMMGFANDGLQRQLDQPSVKLVEGTKDQSAPMKRKEIIDNQIQYLDESFVKVKNLKETDDSRDILKASIALYEYVLPVYKNDYIQLAKLYDDNAPKEQITALSKSIRDKYFTGFEERLNALTNAGKPYAERHKIPVKWGVKTSPDLH
ncbi:MAG: hypothetical protein ABIR15_14280 [Chitinophagaceae bacterium]